MKRKKKVPTNVLNNMLLFYACLSVLVRGADMRWLGKRGCSRRCGGMGLRCERGSRDRIHADFLWFRGVDWKSAL